MIKRWVKVLISVIVGLAAGSAAFVGWVASMFMGRAGFYTVAIAAAYAALMTALVAWTGSRRKIMFAGLCALLVAALAMGIRIGYDGYIASIPVVKESRIQLNEYRPFTEGSKAARLDGQASLRLSDGLPRIDGATALYPLYASFVAATYPEGDYDPESGPVLCTTTGNAYKNLINGDVDVIFCAEPSDEQLRAVAEKGAAFDMTPIGKEAFVFFVNDKNPVTGLSSEQVRGVYSGRITDWSELGGKPGAIKVFQRPKNSGSQTILEKIMIGHELMEPLREEVIDGMGGIIERTADYKNYKNAIGYSFLYYSTRMAANGLIRLLAIDGAYPSGESIRDGSYPFTSSFYAITLGSPTQETKELITWILSNEGRMLVERTGYIR